MWWDWIESLAKEKGTCFLPFSLLIPEHWLKGRGVQEYSHCKLQQGRGPSDNGKPSAKDTPQTFLI